MGLATELLADYKRANRRMFIIILVLIVMWSLTLGYLIYTLNDIGTVETTTQEITDVDSIDNTNIVNGDYNGNDKTNKD